MTELAKRSSQQSGRRGETINLFMSGAHSEQDNRSNRCGTRRSKSFWKCFFLTL